MTENPVHRQALTCADRGWPVFPCQSGRKTPAAPHGYLDATTDPAQIRAWFARRPELNLAVATGAPGPDVLDIDNRGEAGDGFPDRLPTARQWSRRHADTQRRLCDRFAAPVIAAVTCQDIKTAHTQAIVNAAPTAGEGGRVHRMISALVTAGIDAGYLTNPRLAKVHWQAGDRLLPAQQVTVAGESALWVDPAEIPSATDVSSLGRALAAGRRANLHELMACTAAYTGLRWGELAALTIGQVSQARREIRVDRKVVEVGGRLYVEAPKNRKFRRTIYPRRAPGGYPLAERLAARIMEARAEQEAGSNPLGLVFPSRRGGYWRSSNFNRRILQPAYLEAGWRDVSGNGPWTWHSLRHVFCTTALFTWKLDPTDVSRMASHANYRITLDMYVGATAGVLDRARAATE